MDFPPISRFDDLGRPYPVAQESQDRRTWIKQINQNGIFALNIASETFPHSAGVKSPLNPFCPTIPDTKFHHLVLSDGSFPALTQSLKQRSAVDSLIAWT